MKIPTLHEWMNEFAMDERIKMIVLDLKVTIPTPRIDSRHNELLLN